MAANQGSGTVLLRSDSAQRRRQRDEDVKLAAGLLSAVTLLAAYAPALAQTLPAETKDRLDLEAFKPILAAALAAAEANDIDRSRREFDAILSRVIAKNGPSSLGPVLN